MTNQIYILVSFFATGVCIGVLFDIFRVTRRIFKTPNILIYSEDILFWLLTGLLLLFTIFTFTDGQIRLYMILMLILGSFIYFALISRYFIMINQKILDIIKKIINFLILPIKKLIKSIKNIKKISKNCGK